MRKKIAAIASLPLLLIGCSEGDGPEGRAGASTAPAATSGVIGDPIQFSDHAVTGKVVTEGVIRVTSVEWSSDPQKDPDFEVTETPSSGTWLVVHIEWEGSSDFNDALDLAWRPDSTGKNSLPRPGVPGFEPRFGDKSTDAGNVVWDAKREPGVIVLQEMNGDERGSWRVEG